MRTGTATTVDGKFEGVPLHGGLDRFAALVEVSFAFALVHVTYRAFKNFTVFGQWIRKRISFLA